MPESPAGRAAPAWGSPSSPTSRRRAAPAPPARPARPGGRRARPGQACRVRNPRDERYPPLEESPPMPTTTPRWLSSLIPETPLARKLSMQSILYRDRRGRLPHRQRGVLHPDRRPDRVPGRHRHHRRPGRVVPLRRPARQGRRPDRTEADVGPRGVRRCRHLRRVAVRGRLRAVPRHDGGPPDRGDGRALRTRRLHAGRVPPRGAGPIARLHARGPQRGLHRRRADRRRGAGVQQRRHRPGGPVVHCGRAGAERPLHHPAARCGARPHTAAERASC